MTARSVGSLTISCALVSIPVKLHTAVQSTTAIEFKSLAPSGERLRQTLQDGSGEPIVQEAVVKGYEFARGQYVTFTRDEMQAWEEPTTHACKVCEFVPAESIDPRFWDKICYWLQADRGGAHGYALLCAAMRKTGRVAIGHWASHGRDHVVSIRAVGERLMLQQLRWAEDMRPADTVPAVHERYTPQELALAVQLIERTAAPFNPEAHQDPYRARVRKAIDVKISALPRDPQPQHDGKVIDLMAALKASVKAKATKQKRAKQQRKVNV